MTTKMISEETLQPQAGKKPGLRRAILPGVQRSFRWVLVNYERQMNLAFVYALVRC